MHTTTERFSLPVPLEQVLTVIADSYQLGTIQDFSVLLAGYQNLNVKFNTHQGSFVAKFYSNSSSLERNAYVTAAMLTLHSHGLPVPKVLNCGGRTAIPVFKDGIVISYANVLEYFDGEAAFVFGQEDCIALAQIVSRIHSVDLKIERFYDDWGVVNVANEYSKITVTLPEERRELVEGAIEQFKKLIAPASTSA